MNDTAFIYTIYIGATPRRLWEALTRPEDTHRYWGVAYRCDWQPGSVVEVQLSPNGEFRDLGSVVVEARPHERLSFTDGEIPPEHAEMLGWDAADVAAANQENSKVTFDITPAGRAAVVTVTHDGFAPGSKSLEVYQQGWPAVMSSLKTMLETGGDLGIE